ncbi:globin domain-containing protein [Wenjunlia tyrosinilytica]|uniref:globin domain-containing protein n=1 Tax=Wenjunlia tyrosinilytica TaxID=1544741 RepID=UPI0035713205
MDALTTTSAQARKSEGEQEQSAVVPKPEEPRTEDTADSNWSWFAPAKPDTGSYDIESQDPGSRDTEPPADRPAPSAEPPSVPRQRISRHRDLAAAIRPTALTAPNPAPGTAHPSPAAPASGTAPERPHPAPPSQPPSLDDIRPPAAAAGSAQPSPDAIRIRRTMDAIGPVADKVISYFYAVLFVNHPYLRELFPASMDHQRDRLLRALLTAAKHVDDSRTLGEYLSHLGRGHRKYGTRPEHYPAVGEALIAALSRYAGDVWDEETEAAWVRAYTAISQTMIDSAAAEEDKSPPWWHAEIVSHEVRTSDIAVITVRPDQPYPFLAGQYTTLETPWWPRVWRNYSFAGAPSPNGLLSFHVKAVPAGWVSSALVHRARPGDVIRLGPPTGSMVVDHRSPNGLLCLGGGTGIAPIKALVEDVAEHGVRRPVEVFYGARSDVDLYELDTMLRLAQQHPWLSVRPVVSDAPTRGLSGPLPDIVRQYGPWHSFDAYLSGPPAMIRSSVDTLMGIGIPSHRIRHDFVGDLVGTEG